ncbi:MAG: hypothetical protein WC004_01270 [Candidatus Absconditabacterales bacterium]
MSHTQLIHTIQTLSPDKQQQLRELYQLIDKLYQQYGNKLLDTNILETIGKDSTDLAQLIQHTHETVGLPAVHDLVPELERVCDLHIMEITAKDPQSIGQRIQAKQKDSQIHLHQDDIVGIKVQSSDGQKYERTIDKDIAKLTR